MENALIGTAMGIGLVAMVYGSHYLVLRIDRWLDKNKTSTKG